MRGRTALPARKGFLPGVSAGASLGVQDHRRLSVYHEAKALAVQVYVVAASLPPEERYGMASQLKRAAVSVGSNIAEGCGRTGARDFAGFLAVALGSSREIEFQLELCRALKIGSDAAIDTALERALRVQRMLIRLISAVRAPRR